MRALQQLELFCFDMAGTTIADNGAVLDAFATAARTADLTPDTEWLKARMGWYKRRVFAELLSEAGRDPDTGAGNADELTATFDAVLARSYVETPPSPLPGAIECFGALREAGVAIAFTTGFTRAIAELLLSALQWDADALVASDEGFDGRPSPGLILECMHRCGVTDPRRVGAAGDTPGDLAAGTAAGCLVVAGVGHGTHSLAELANAPHTCLVGDLFGLLEVLRADVPG